jgi:hypothetical protein
MTSSGAEVYATRTGSVTRRERSESVQFVTRSDVKPAFGTMTSAPSHVRMAERAGDHGLAEHRELRPQNPHHSTPTGQRGVALAIRQESLRADGECQERNPCHHLQQKDALLQHRNRRAHLASSIDQEERRQRVDSRSDCR